MDDNINTKILDKVDKLLKEVEEGQIIINITKASPKKTEVFTKVFEKIEN